MRTMRVNRRAAILALTAAMVVGGFDAVVAQASPPPDPGTTAACHFTLTSPSVVNVKGTDLVTATLNPGECTGTIQPNSYTVCVGLLGEGTPQCNFRPVFDPVRVYFAPYRKGATYSSTGRVCGNVFPTAEQSCSSFGPYQATL